MIKQVLSILILIAALSTQANAQTPNNLQEINKVWNKFNQAFEQLNPDLMAEIHSKELLRISGGKRISDYETYIGGYKTRFEKAKTEGVSNLISLRFFERINNKSVASERGIYKLVRTDKEGNSQTYYGQFHVILQNEDGEWKITMDYDSNEGNTIGEKEYQKAHALTDIDKFVR